jgi:hypothetical protein
MMALLRERCRRQTRGFQMIWKRIRRTSKSRNQSWKQIDQSPIPLSAGRIWLADSDGNVTRALAWTWPILKRREPRKYRWWMNRANHAREPAAESVAALRELRQGNKP